EPVNIRVLSNLLTAAGYRVTAAGGGAEALDRLQDPGFDLVLLDVMMPKMSGYEVCRSLRTRLGVEELPVIFLTAKTQEADLVAGFAEGGNDYLLKPVTKAELLARVSLHLRVLDAYRRRREEAKELGGMLPICSSCKKIRDDDGYWNQLETFLEAHSGTSLTHGLCPACLEELVAEIKEDDP
ncbi:MAG: response regulator, partial [Acidobacteriota bacterium]